MGGGGGTTPACTLDVCVAPDAAGNLAPYVAECAPTPPPYTGFDENMDFLIRTQLSISDFSLSKCFSSSDFGLGGEWE